MSGIQAAIVSFLAHEKTAIATIAVAVLIAIADGLREGHVVWSTIGYAALTALAGVARSALGTSTSGADGPDAER